MTEDRHARTAALQLKHIEVIKACEGAQSALRMLELYVKISLKYSKLISEDREKNKVEMEEKAR